MRPTLDQYLMELASVAATRTTCVRAGVGCVLADAKGRILAVAYNGVARGQPHCNHEARVPVYPDDPRVVHNYAKKMHIFRGKKTPFAVVEKDPEKQLTPCVGFDDVLPHACEGHDLPPGQDKCEAIHAEQNAILQCHNTDLIATAYVTKAPCRPCMKLLLNTGCERIVFAGGHPGMEEVAAVWRSSGRTWEQMT
jgi:deoxycytidylate deaminase